MTGELYSIWKMPDCETCKKIDIEGPIDGGFRSMVWFFINEILDAMELTRLGFILAAFLIGYWW